MPSSDVSGVLATLLTQSEAEWIEFKKNNWRPEEIGENISAVSNAARLHQRDIGYIIWGVEDGTRKVVGTVFKPHDVKVKQQELENWLATQLEPRIDFKIHEISWDGKQVVIFAVQPCTDRPVGFKGVEYIRVGSYTKRLKDHPEKERALWIKGSQINFEKEIAIAGARTAEVTQLVDCQAYFKMAQQPLPASESAIMLKLESEKLLIRAGNEKWNITNLCAILFARKLSDFDSLARKAVRVVVYNGRDRTKTTKEQEGILGYASGFARLVGYINDQLPTNEEIGQALRRQARMYPEIAIRELVANAIIHQDFRMRGVSPMIEIFEDRIEITNPGPPLISTLRFIDEPPQSRNEQLAALMRRLNVCEERGSGIDKVIFEVEYFQLPAPEFTASESHTKVTMFAHKKLTDMGKEAKIRACYQHSCLLYVSNQDMTNATLRKRFMIEEQNYSIASRIIGDTLKADLIKAKDPENTSRKHAKYVPFWS